jgi:hypothetical protein
VRAHRWRRKIETGEAKSITDLAEQEGVTDAYVCRLLPLTCLAPDIVEAILDGRQPKGLRLAEMLGNWPRRGRDREASGDSLGALRRALSARGVGLSILRRRVFWTISMTSRQCSCRLSTLGIVLQPAIDELRGPLGKPVLPNQPGGRLLWVSLRRNRLSGISSPSFLSPHQESSS